MLLQVTFEVIARLLVRSLDSVNDPTPCPSNSSVKWCIYIIREPGETWPRNIGCDRAGNPPVQTGARGARREGGNESPGTGGAGVGQCPVSSSHSLYIPRLVLRIKNFSQFPIMICCDTVLSDQWVVTHSLFIDILSVLIQENLGSGGEFQSSQSCYHRH